MKRQALKFTVENKKQFIIELRENVTKYFDEKKLSQYGNVNLFLKTAFMFILYLSPYLLMITGIINSFAGVLLCWFVMGLGKAGMGMAVMHDANHKSYSPKSWLNRLMGNTIYLLGGSPITWQYQHNTLHHGFTNIDGYDEDIDPGSVLRFSPHKPLLRMHRYQYIYAWILYGLMTLTWVTTKDFKQLVQYKKEGVALSNKQSNIQLWFVLILSKLLYYIVFLIIPIVILPFAWYWIVVFFLVMHFTSGFILTVIFQTAHVVPSSKYPLPDAKNTLENNWAVHQLFTTSDFAPRSKIFSWFIGGLNYQVEHHLFPNISHVHYNKISKLVKEMAHKYHLPYHVQPTFFSALSAHRKMLKKLGRVAAI